MLASSIERLPMDLLPHLLSYYQGERTGSIIALCAGLVLLVVVLFIRQRSTTGSFSRGLLWPWLIVGGLLTASAPFMWMNNHRRLERMPVELQSDARAFVEKDLARMHIVNQAWLPLKVFWTLLVVAGLGLTFTGRAPHWKGLGMAVLLIGALGHVADGIASRNAEQYTRQLLQAQR